MAPAVHRFQVETTLASNPRFVLQNLVAVLGVLEIVVGVFFHSPVSIMTRSGGVEGGVLLALGWRTRQIRENFGHMSGYP